MFILSKDNLTLTDFILVFKPLMICCFVIVDL